MLILGLQIHGLNGSEDHMGIDKIEISKMQSEKWYEMYKNRNDKEEEYFDMKMLFHERKMPDKVEKAGKVGEKEKV